MNSEASRNAKKRLVQPKFNRRKGMREWGNRFLVRIVKSARTL